MPVVRVVCVHCGRDLGSYATTNFGIGDMESKIQHDPDCPDCNPHYWKRCPACNAQTIDRNGVCRACGRAVAAEGDA